MILNIDHSCSKDAYSFVFKICINWILSRIETSLSKITGILKFTMKFRGRRLYYKNPGKNSVCCLIIQMISHRIFIVLRGNFSTTKIPMNLRFFLSRFFFILFWLVYSSKVHLNMVSDIFLFTPKFGYNSKKK